MAGNAFEKLHKVREYFVRVMPLLVGVLIFVAALFDGPALNGPIPAVYGLALCSCGILMFRKPRIGYWLTGPVVALGILAISDWRLDRDQLFVIAAVIGCYWIYALTTPTEDKTR